MYRLAATLALCCCVAMQAQQGLLEHAIVGIRTGTSILL